jgi:hypothetical protein
MIILMDLKAYIIAPSSRLTSHLDYSDGFPFPTLVERLGDIGGGHWSYGSIPRQIFVVIARRRAVIVDR